MRSRSARSAFNLRVGIGASGAEEGDQKYSDRSLRTLMANKSQGTWFVSFDVPRREKRSHMRATETFPNEREAKNFARAKLAKTQNVNAGTINPHLPKRTVASARMPEWLEERDEDDLASAHLGMQAINRHRVREFDTSRKPHHWGKRKLKRDQ
jgi:hypothetical protein